MEKSKITGKVHVFGDDINTDAIIPGKYTKTLDIQTFADHVLEDLDPEFKNIVQPGDILVAGDNFGCGSSREQAALAIKVAGVSAVIAKYFARIFFRNAINIGLPVLEVGEFDMVTGDQISIDLEAGKVENLTRAKTYTAAKMPQVMIDILAEGGLVNYLKKHGDYLINPP
ncbi:MAG: 3-isopropylmalate dehydratase small subunit [Desulfobacterales bacterium]|nr:MAG: 3-isopropylmalate dehydratase small subunit [Desulfobacterales bacterium]